MRARSHFQQDLLDLGRRLEWLGETVQRALRRASWALLHGDVAAARQVVAGDAEINRLFQGIEEYALEIIALNHPFAGDLRQISASMRVAFELERIGDYCRGICTIVVRSADLPPADPPAGLQEMVEHAGRMLARTLQEVAAPDAGAAQRLEQMDDVVDELYRQVFAALVATMRAHPEQIRPAMYLLWAMHNLERIADRTVNIAEHAANMATGVVDACA